MQPQYQSAVNNAQQDYGNIMGQYQNFMQGIGQNNPLSGLNYGNNAGLGNQGEVNSALKGYQNFADTGGFSQQNLGAMQQASMAPIRGAYAMAQGAAQQGQGLAGGYSPNLAAAQSQMARQQGQQMSQQEIASQANIANLVQQGKLAGLGGLSQTALQNQAEGLQAAAINNQYNLGVGGLNLQNEMMRGQQALGGLSGQAGMYGATPGQAGMLQNYLLGIQGLQGQGQSLQNQLSLGIMNAQNQKAMIPGNFQQALGNIGSMAGILGNIGKGLGGLSGGGGSPGMPGTASGYNPNYQYGSGGAGDYGPALPPGYNPGIGGFNDPGPGAYNDPGLGVGNGLDDSQIYNGGYGGGSYYDDGETNWGG